MLSQLKCRRCGTVFMADPDYKGIPCPKCHVFDEIDIQPGPILPRGIIKFPHEGIFHWEDE